MPAGDKLRKISEILGQVSEGVGNIAAPPGPLSRVDFLNAAQPPGENRGFAGVLGNYAGNAARARIGFQNYENEQKDAEAKRQLMTAQSEQYTARADLLDSQRQSTDMKNLILEATTPDQIEMAKAKVEEVRANAQQRLAQAQYRRMQATTEPQFKMLQQEIAMYEAQIKEADMLGKFVLARKENEIKQQVANQTGEYQRTMGAAATTNAATGQQRANTQDRNVDSLVGLRAKLGELADSNSARYKATTSKLQERGLSAAEARNMIYGAVAREKAGDISPEEMGEIINMVTLEGDQDFGVGITPQPNWLQGMVQKFTGSQNQRPELQVRDTRPPAGTPQAVTSSVQATATQKTQVPQAGAEVPITQLSPALQQEVRAKRALPKMQAIQGSRFVFNGQKVIPVYPNYVLKPGESFIKE